MGTINNPLSDEAWPIAPPRLDWKSPVALLRWLLDILATWQERAAQRSNLQSLDHRMLKDIGLSRIDVARECGKPFWRA